MIEQILVLPEIRIVVLEKIEQSASRPPKYLVDICGNIQLWAEYQLNAWRSRAVDELPDSDKLRAVAEMLDRP